MSVNLRKFLQLIVFFAHQDAVKPLGKTKLFKLLYFTDVTHLRTAGESLTGADYIKYPYGPVPTQGAFALNELQKHRYIHQKRTQQPHTRALRELTALHAPDMTLFTEQEMRTITYVIQEYGGDTASGLSWKSHQESAWLLASDWQPLHLVSEKPRMEQGSKNAEALALLREWAVTPDDRPPGYWDELLEEIEAHPFQLDDEDLHL